MSCRRILSFLIVMVTVVVMYCQAWCLQFLIDVSLLNLHRMQPIVGMLEEGFIFEYLTLASGNGLLVLIVLLFTIMLAVEWVSKSYMAKLCVQISCLLTWGAVVASLLYVTSVHAIKMGETKVAGLGVAVKRVTETTKME